jgi:xylan 1,4-beta-xylosidase
MPTLVKFCCAALASALIAVSVSLAAAPVKIAVHLDEPIADLRPIWNYFGYDEAGTTLTPEGRHLLSAVNELSEAPIRIRVHHLLTSGDGTLALKWSSTNAYTEDANGNPIYNWTMMDAIMDELTQPGVEPFVQAGFMPEDLSSQPTPYTPPLTQRGLPKDMVSGGAFYPPKDYQKWQNLIAAWAQHCVDRYGRERAESWLWEAWNEPESPYWKGTMEEFFMLYDHFAAGVKSVLPHAQVGGPHVTDPGWKNGDIFMEAFLEHCRSGLNAATGEIGTPLDFIAFHAKGTTRIDEQGRVEMNLRNQLQTIETYGQIIANFPEYASLPIYIGESDPEGCAGCPATLDPERDYRRTSQFAAYTAASFLRKQDLLARTGGNLQGAVSWAFTFHDQPWFNGLRALTTNEITLPVFNTFKLFARLGPHRVKATSPAMLDTSSIITTSVRDAPDIGVVATRTDDGALRILLWNYHDVADRFDEPTPITLQLHGLTADHDLAAATLTRVDAQHANAYTTWRDLGEPQKPSPQDIARLHQAATLQSAPIAPSNSADDSATFVFDLLRQSVVLLEIPPSR